MAHLALPQGAILARPRSEETPTEEAGLGNCARRHDLLSLLIPLNHGLFQPIGSIYAEKPPGRFCAPLAPPVIIQITTDSLLTPSYLFSFSVVSQKTNSRLHENRLAEKGCDLLD